MKAANGYQSCVINGIQKLALPAIVEIDDFSIMQNSLL